MAHTEPRWLRDLRRVSPLKTQFVVNRTHAEGQ